MSCLTPISIKMYNSRGTLLGYKSVPCGKCPYCLARKRSEWSARLLIESLDCACCWFVTLTYDDEHLPLEGVNKSDVQLFLKRLRKKVKCRYYITSEYGDKFGRPHYHGIFFFPEMVSLPEIVRLIDGSWQNGNIQVGEVNLATINYVSKYSMKFRYDENRIFPNRTFAMMSRQPGIGASYVPFEKVGKKKVYKVTRDIKIHQEDLDPRIFINGVEFPMHRYYQDKIFNKAQKLKINKKIQEKYGEISKQERNQDWLERYERAVKRFSRR